MTPPLPAEVEAYAKSIGFDLDADHFCDYYEARGWLIGKHPMKSWKAAVRLWKRRQQQSENNRTRLTILGTFGKEL